jgi:hypothetical protein
LPDSQTLIAHFDALRAARGSLEGAPSHDATQIGAQNIVAADPGQPQARIDLAQFEAVAQALHFRTEGPRESPASPWSNLLHSPVVSAQSPTAPISTPQVPSGAAQIPGSATPHEGQSSAPVPSHEAPPVHPAIVAADPGQPQAQIDLAQFEAAAQALHFRPEGPRELPTSPWANLPHTPVAGPQTHTGGPQPAAVPSAPPRASEPEPPRASGPAPTAPTPAAAGDPAATGAPASNIVAADPGQPQARIDLAQFEAAAQVLHFRPEGPRELPTSPWANLPRTAVVSSQAASTVAQSASTAHQAGSVVPQAYADVPHAAATPAAGAPEATETTGLPDWPELPEWPLAWYEPASAERAPLRERTEGAWYV